MICKVNPSIVKVQMSVNKDTATIQEVIDGGDERGVDEAKANVKGVVEERGMDGWSIVIIYITERGDIRWGSKFGNGTDGKRRSAKEV